VGRSSLNTAPKQEIYEFGEFRLEAAERRLLRDGIPLALPPKVFDTLVLLVQNAGRLLSKDELMKGVWPDTFVEEVSLAQNISQLRKALGETVGDGQMIQTVAKRGYRFTAPVSVANESKSENGLPKDVPLERIEGIRKPKEQEASKDAKETLVGVRPSSRRKLWMGLGVAALVLTGLSYLVFSKVRGEQRDGRPVIRSIAVLPLANLSADPEQEFFADGMTDELIADLARIRALQVISRTSVMQYKGTRKTLPQIARELNVDAVVEGTVLRSGNQVRITAQLIQAPLDKHLWANSYQGDLHDVLSLQNSVANAIANEIRVALTPQERALLGSRKEVNPTAYEDYLQGRYFWNKRDGGAMETAIRYFQQAIAIDPNYAPAFAGLAQTYILIDGPKDEYVAAGKKAAQQALALDPNLAEAHTALALLLGSEYDFTGEEREFKMAVTLDPNYATGHHWYGEAFLAQIGRFDEANHEMQLALALDPASRIIATDWGATLFFERRYDEAYRQLSHLIEIEPGFSEARLWRGKGLLQQGKFQAGIDDLETASRINPANFHISATLAYAYGVSGNRAKAHAQLQSLLAESRMRYISSWAIGFAYFGAGEKQQSFDWLEKAVREHSADMPAAKVTPECDSVRQDPRFKKILASMNLPG
jgi:TolB-like protein/DNA-binding winged helix-turn-helix (wHTH) protein/Tfp pilus assembly protein PilF